ncbi:hypothetical protein ACW9HQ_36550 [Nocardia gipuzkoensis]
MSGTRRLRLIAQTTAVCAALLLPAALATTAAASPATTHPQGNNGASDGKSKPGKAGKSKAKGGESDTQDNAKLGDALNGLMGVLGADPSSTPTKQGESAPPLDDQQLADLGRSLGAFANGFMSAFQPPA